MKLRVLIITFVLGLIGCSAEVSNLLDNTDRFGYYYVKLKRKDLNQRLVEETKLIVDHRYDKEFVFGYVGKRHYDQLVSRLRSRPEILNPHYASASFDTKTLRLESLPEKNGYHDYQALTSKLRELQQSFPDLAALHTAGQSVQGRELWYMKLSDHVEQDETEPKLLYIANMHGDETVGRELMLFLIEHLLTSYQDGANNLLDHAQIYIMPSMNPDGFERYSRFNAQGVDLNRDFPEFIHDDLDEFTGRAPETQAVMRLHRKHHFLLALNFHGGAVCINLPWDAQSNQNEAKRFGDDPFLYPIAREYADTNAAMANDQIFDRGLTYGYEWYQVLGGMQDWANRYRGSIHATVELSNQKWPSADRLPTFWQDNQRALIQFLKHGLEGVHMRLRNEQGHPLLGASVSVSSQPQRRLRYPGAHISRLSVLAPSLTVSIEAPGYKPRQIELSAEDFQGQFHEVTLIQ